MAAFSASVKVNQEALDRVKARMGALKERVVAHRVTVGIHEDRGSERKIDYEGKSAETLSLAEIARIHEFGARGRPPKRSFIRAWFDTHKHQLKQEMTQLIRKEFQGDKDAIPVAAKQWGQDLKAWIESGIGMKSLALETVIEKQKSGLSSPGSPLIATRQLVEAITAAVDGKEV